jgi:hypothetical protein
MTIAVTLLMSSGDPDPTWTLTPDQEVDFLDLLGAAPLPSVSVGPPSRRPGYGGMMVRDGSGERWVVYRGWIRGGSNLHVDDKRVVEQWLLDTGRSSVGEKLMAELTRQITPSS